MSTTCFCVVTLLSSSQMAHGKDCCLNVSSRSWEGVLHNTKNGCKGDYGLKVVSCKLGKIENKFVGMVVSSVSEETN